MAHDIAGAALRVWRGREGPDELTAEERREVGAAVRQLRAGLVGERALVGARYLDDSALRAAYLLYHVPLNAARMASILPELDLVGEGPLRVLDVGAGPGSLGLAAALGARRAAREVRVLSTDRSTPALGLGTQLAAHLGLEAAWHSLVWRLPDEAPAALREGRYDLILLGNVLNELWSDKGDAVERRSNWLLHLARTRLAPCGRVVLLEPALRETGRALLELRSLLVEGGLFVHAPCLFQEPCPALERQRDWCHQARLWSVPPPVAALSEEASVDNERLNFAYLILGAEPPKQETDPRLFRVVSAPMIEKGKRVLWGCGLPGRHKLVRLNRRQSAANADFERLDRGDLVRIDGLAEKGDGLRVGEETEVRRVFSAILPS